MVLMLEEHFQIHVSSYESVSPCKCLSINRKKELCRHLCTQRKEQLTSMTKKYLSKMALKAAYLKNNSSSNSQLPTFQGGKDPQTR